MGRVEEIKEAFAFAATGTTASTRPTRALNQNGIVKLAVVSVPNFTNAITVALTIKNADGKALYTKTTIANNADTILSDDTSDTMSGVPIRVGDTVQVDLSGAAGGSGGTVTVYLRVKD